MIQQLVSLGSKVSRQLAILTMLAVVSLATVIGVGNASAASSCRGVHGRVVDQLSTGSQSSARMIGSISGTYVVTVVDAFSAGTVVPSVIFATSDSSVETKKGTIFFSETSSLDIAEQDSVNGAALLTITGGDGEWQDASGHLSLSGFFHVDSGTGEWDYQGEICLP